MRVLQWIVERVNGKAEGQESPFGWMPRHQDLNWQGLDFAPSAFSKIMDIDREEGKREAENQKELFESFDAKLPDEMERQRKALLQRLDEAPEVWHVAD